MALGVVGYIPFGVEFDQEAASIAGKTARCTTMTVDEFEKRYDGPQFDAVHLGDVLEHLPDPANTIRVLLRVLKPNGVLFVEGPLEINPSLIYWTSRIYGAIKRKVRPKFIAKHPPTHLYLTGGSQQFAFFLKVEPALCAKRYDVFETGALS